MHYRNKFIGNKVEFLTKKKKDETKEENQDRNNIFEEFGKSIEIEEDDLPFN